MQKLLLDGGRGWFGESLVLTLGITSSSSYFLDSVLAYDCSLSGLSFALRSILACFSLRFLP